MPNGEYNCYRVTVKTTNALKDCYVRYSTETVQTYGRCIDGGLYVLANSYEEVENIVGDNIIEIRLIGYGLVAKGGDA